ncbi:uncharacterized protein GGS22DRAFT_139994 [Annulohypoxylon maeteangense]|uniref:uncharacterized protein n=1 Tax=Annulohypoxylon maeteangense TaxID=1927788 RepID=UPI0020076699|nr:uncharacterized protein GGS22DRAFT_139994 [Annulohypoxylon maeteangense]KAI0885179.1 hypothetical protein GGS22DRAFT_139994 [Annulohypoxylon maeteangense]
MGTEKVNYTGFTDFLSEFPDTLAVKRFRDLQIRNLLFYQAELAHLRVELEEIEQRDVKHTIDVSARANFRWTPAMAKDIPFSMQQPTISSLYREKMLQIRSTLVSYNNAVEQYKRLNDIPCPRRRDITAICDWLNRMNMGGAFLAGDIEDVWNVQTPTGEFKPAKADEFYAFQDNSGLAFRIGAIFASISEMLCRGSKPDKPHYVNTSSASALDRSISTIIASLFPVIPIIVFYFVRRLGIRIGLIFVFTAAFAAILVLGLQLKPEKALAITTAIAAIQVVYVGSTANGGDS